MQHKLKSILKNRKKSTSPQREEERTQSSDASNTYVEQHSASSNDKAQALSDSYERHAHQSSRSRPLSSVYDNQHVSNASQPTAGDYSHANPSDLPDESIVYDYKSYLPVLSSAKEPNDNQNTTLGADRRLLAGDNDGRHAEDVADRNIDRYATSPEGQRRKLTHRDGLANSNPPHKEVTTHEKNHWRETQYPIRSARNEPGTGRFTREPRVSDDDNNISQSPPGDRQNTTARSQEQPAGLPTATTNDLLKTNNSHDTGSSQDWKLQQQSLLDGVVDLKDSVETHKETHWAPAVTHEVVKRHEHEIVQSKIYREIHNYSYYHRLQPVIHTEVLAPRHFIPNPHGDGLVEIAAEELPARTGKNRWWDIVQKDIQQPSVPDTPHQWRMEPEVIEGKPYMTEEGFERRETTIRYPPTMEDMSNYGGVVQPVHFDHKTGQRWLGEVTTMNKLREQIQHMSLRKDPDELPASPMVKRKPINGADNGTPNLESSAFV